MELGINQSSKLEPFMLMAKSMKGAAAAKLVQDATSAPGVFVFSELLELPNIQELGNNEQHTPFFSLLQLFAYRTYQDYLKHKESLPSLNQAQITKLKHLSIVTLAADRRILPYTELMQALDMPSIRELEDLVIDAIYLNILRGKLDQKEGQFEVSYTMGRDLEPGKVESLLAALQDWATTTASVLATLDEKIAEISSLAATEKAGREQHESSVSATIKDLSDTKKDKPSVGRRVHHNHASDARDSMDVDDPPEHTAKAKNRKLSSQTTEMKQQRKRNKF